MKGREGREGGAVAVVKFNTPWHTAGAVRGAGGAGGGDGNEHIAL